MPWVHGCRYDDIRVWAAGAESKWRLRENLQMLIFDQHSGRLLGNAGFPRLNWGVRSFEIGYWLRLSAEGHGFMQEAVQLLTRLAFNDLEANRVEIHVDPRNTRSCNVALRLDFRLEGTLRNCAPDGYGHPSDRHIYALIPLDYQALEWSRSSSLG
jgi:RimJ/RimL family protein N-acetyltransferase